MRPMFCSLLLGLTNSWRVVSVFPKNFHTTLCQTITSWRFIITNSFHQKNHFIKLFVRPWIPRDLLLLKLFIARITSCSLISSSQTFFFLLKVGIETSLRNSLYVFFVFLKFLLNKFSKILSNFLLISTKLFISLLLISFFLTEPSVSLVFSRFRKKIGCFFALFTPLAFTSYFNGFKNTITNFFKLIFIVKIFYWVYIIV